MPSSLYLINLARRPDRLAKMAAQLESLELDFERVDAIDAETVTTTELSALAPRGPLGPFQRGPQCCTLSHLRTFALFLATGASHAILLEDDVRLGPDAARLLENLDWVPPSAGIVKLERFGPEHQRVLVEKGIRVAGDRKVARLWSKHTGAAAYIISREAATRALALKPVDMDIDHLLFNPSLSPVFARLNVFQMIPALAVQTKEPTDTSDVAARRGRARGLSSIRLKLSRAAHELRALPGQVRGVAIGRTRLERLGYR